MVWTIQTVQNPDFSVIWKLSMRDPEEETGLSTCVQFIRSGDGSEGLDSGFAAGRIGMGDSAGGIKPRNCEERQKRAAHDSLSLRLVPAVRSTLKDRKSVV